MAMADQKLFPVADPLCLLYDLLSEKTDTTVTFDGDEAVDGHCCILRLHSPVLAQALELAPSSRDGSSPAKKTITMPGTSRADFLTVRRRRSVPVPAAAAAQGQLGQPGGAAAGGAQMGHAGAWLSQPSLGQTSICNAIKNTCCATVLAKGALASA
jgi:hypothetical protein